jgi:flagellar secretion chaperone FliS
MFASPFSQRHAQHTPGRSPLGNLYQDVGLTSRLAGASQHQMVSMLFEAYMDSLALARGALRAGDIVAKGQAISRAVRIVEEGLRSGLNLQAGGELAHDLHDLYNYVTARLTMANARNNDDMLDECQRLVAPLQEAWLAIANEADAAA